MATDILVSPRPTRHRADLPEPSELDFRSYLAPTLWSIAAASFVLLGGANLDLTASEAKLGLSAVEELRPFGQVNGTWDPSVWAGSIMLSRLWEILAGLGATSAAVRWPAAIAGLLIGFVISRTATKAGTDRAGLLVGLCWFGSIGLIDHSSATGLDLILGLGVVFTLNRLLTRGSDWLAGLGLAWAFLSGGWPPVALVLLSTIVIGRREASLSFRLLIPPVLAFAGWSTWCLSVAPADLWGAALAMPLTLKSAWTFAPGVLLLGLPWAPLAGLAASKSVRAGWDEKTAALAKGWAQIAGASLIIGTVVPGLAATSRVPALAGISVLAGLSLSSMLKADRVMSRQARTALRVMLGLLVGTWIAIVMVRGGYLGFAVSYYRMYVYGSIILAVAATGLAVASIQKGSPRVALAALICLSAGVKLAHYGYYAPELNYRLSQGPWGRAVGQWVPRTRVIHVTHEWAPDFTFAIGRPVRRIADPSLLKSQPGPDPKFVLLHGEEFTHWPERAGKLVKVADFLDEFGSPRVLARTEGPFSWRQPKQK